MKLFWKVYEFPLYVHRKCDAYVFVPQKEFDEYLSFWENVYNLVNSFCSTSKYLKINYKYNAVAFPGKI